VVTVPKSAAAVRTAQVAAPTDRLTVDLGIVTTLRRVPGYVRLARLAPRLGAALSGWQVVTFGVIGPFWRRGPRCGPSGMRG